jgi:hypothetical protein
MKIIKIATMLLFLSIIGCKKKVVETEVSSTNPPILLVNRTLIGIPLDTLRNLISGSWLQKSEMICGGAGCNTTYSPIGQEDIVSFLSQDTVKKIRPNGTLVIYDKAVISLSSYDNSWVYRMHGGLATLAFLRIANDTLILRPFGGGGSESRLVKKI